MFQGRGQKYFRAFGRHYSEMVFFSFSLHFEANGHFCTPGICLPFQLPLRRNTYSFLVTTVWCTKEVSLMLCGRHGGKWLGCTWSVRQFCGGQNGARDSSGLLDDVQSGCSRVFLILDLAHPFFGKPDLFLKIGHCCNDSKQEGAQLCRRCFP